MSGIIQGCIITFIYFFVIMNSSKNSLIYNYLGKPD